MKPDPSRIEPWLDSRFQCSCGQEHRIPLREVAISSGALRLVPEYCAKEAFSRVLLVVDSRTLDAAGRRLKELFSEHTRQEAPICVLADNELGEVAADEQAIVQVLLDMPPQTQAIIAVGSGTIHDIVRFVCYKTGCDFISVPTAPSVDGFSSVGAPLLIQGFKQTIPACAPSAIFADLDILTKAPQTMVAAGFADMLGKFTSLADWELGRILFGEHYCSTAAEMTRRALNLCIDHIEGIRNRSALGIQKLMEGLILSGISMLMVGNSRPASGAEHHLSHYWEMKFIQQRRKALLHGAKVGAAAVLMAGLYESIALLTEDEVQERVTTRLEQKTYPTEEQDRHRIQQAYGKIADQVLRENFPQGRSAFPPIEDIQPHLVGSWDRILSTAQQVPSPAQMTAWLQTVGGPATPEQLEISPLLVDEALDNAMFVRNRFTILRLNRIIR
jgi:glycerol-1-phosphate dehydrogenase [NAD(P)+]